MTVWKLLFRMFGDVFEVEFTARLERELDRVETGKDAWDHVVADFYAPFQKDLTTAESQRESLKASLAGNPTASVPSADPRWSSVTGGTVLSSPARGIPNARPPCRSRRRRKARKRRRSRAPRVEARCGSGPAGSASSSPAPATRTARGRAR